MLVAKYGMVDFYFSRAHHSPDTCKNQIANSLEFLAILSLCCSLWNKQGEVGTLKHIECLRMISETIKSQETDTKACN